MPRLIDLVQNEAKLSELYRSAKTKRDDQMRVVDELLTGYHTPWYRSAEPFSNVRYDPENHAYQYSTLVVPQIVLQNPRYWIETMLSGAAEAIAVQHKHLVNRRVEEIDLYEVLWQCAHDFLFSRCIAWVGVEEDMNYPLEDGDYAMNPVVRRVSPRDFVEDPRAIVPRDCRFRGHEWNSTKEELLGKDEDEGWDFAAIRSLPDNKNINDDRLTDGPERDEVRMLSLWFPGMIVDEDALPEDGFNGAVMDCAVLDGGTLRCVRPLTPYKGPDWGPYVFTGASYVLDNIFPLSPLVAGYGQSRDHNRMRRKAIAEFMKYKRLKGIPGGAQNVIEALKKGADSGLIPLPSAEAAAVADLETGGTSDQFMLMLEDLQRGYDRNMAVSDASRAVATGGKTATEDQLAATAGDVRISAQRGRFHGCFIKPIGRAMSWFYHHEERARGYLPRGLLDEMSDDALRSMGIDPENVPEGDIMFEGGDHKKIPDVSWSALDISVEPYAAEYTTPSLMQKRALDVLSTIPVLRQIEAMGGDAEAVANVVGGLMNIRNLGKLAGLGNGAPVPMGAPGMEQPAAASAGLPGNEMGAQLARAYRG